MNECNDRTMRTLSDIRTEAIMDFSNVFSRWQVELPKYIFSCSFVFGVDIALISDDHFIFKTS